MPAAAFWICCCAYLNCAGWLLSACHQLNVPGYLTVLLPGLPAAMVWFKKNPPAFNPCKFFHRFRRPLPAVFLGCTVLIFLGGILYAPSNFDALTYRLPRMLHWQAAGQWFWIPTIIQRMNYSGVAWEWVAMPFLVLTHSDRGMFLINALGFLLMPGLLFSIFRQLGVARRVAWTWMWILPLAYGYATQAGSIGNDLTGTLFGLLSVHFGLRSRRSGRMSDVWLALVAAALMTGVKLSDLPLALPCVVAVWPALTRLKKHWLAGLAIAGICVMISALPIMALNQIYAGSWNGDPKNQYQMQASNPLAALLMNGFLLAEQSLVPPVLPHSREINNHLTRALPETLKAQFPRLVLNNVTEFPGEEGAALGLGVTAPLLIILAAAACGFRRAGPGLKPVFSLLPPVVLAAWISILFYMVKMGSEAGPRLLLPYYPLVIVPFLLLSAQCWLLRFRRWRVLLLLMASGCLPVVILSVARPLWPAQSISGWVARAYPENKLLQRLAVSYAAYGHRNDFLAPVRDHLPESAREIGFIAGSNDSCYSLWRPFGQRRVTDLRYDAPLFFRHPDAVEWVVVKEKYWPEVSAIPLGKWADLHQAKIVTTLPIVELISWGPENWCLLHIGTEQPARAEAGTDH